MKTFLCHSLTNGTIDQSVDLALFRKCPKADGEGQSNKTFSKVEAVLFYFPQKRVLQHSAKADTLLSPEVLHSKD